MSAIAFVPIIFINEIEIKMKRFEKKPNFANKMFA